MHFNQLFSLSISTKQNTFSEDDLLINSPFEKAIFGISSSNSNIFNLIRPMENKEEINPMIIQGTSKISSKKAAKNHKNNEKKIKKDKKIKENTIDQENGHNNDQDPNTKPQKPKKQKFKNDDFKNGRWTNEEHKLFIESIIKFGNDWKKVEKYIGTRSSTQARSHAQKFFEKMKIANMIDEVIDLDNKTSIKSLQETLRLMEKEDNLYTVEDVNGITFERKKTLVNRVVRNKNKANNESIPDNFGDLERDSEKVYPSNTTSIINACITIEDKEQSVSPLSTSGSRESKEKSIKVYSKEQNLADDLCTNSKITNNSINYSQNYNKSNTNKLLQKKRLRNFSYNSYIDMNINVKDFTLHLDDYDFDSEMEDFEFQNVLIEVIEECGKPDDEDFSDSDVGVFYVGNDFDRDYCINYELEPEENDEKSGKDADEIFYEFLAN